MRIVFCGSPDFSCPSLKALIESHHQIALVITQPDRPKGRGQRCYPPPVKIVALKAGLPVEQPGKIAHITERLEQIKPDIMVVIAYGQIIPKELLAIPKFGGLNVHGSLLPSYRGASPIQWAIIEGDEKTGLTTIQMDEGMDTGDILLQKEIAILPEDTAGSLSEKMASLGAEVLMETLSWYEKGEVVRLKQNNELATYTRLLKKKDGIIDWNQPAERICRLIRGLNPWPAAFSYLRGRRIKVMEAHPIGSVVREGSAGVGKIVRADRKEGLVVEAGQNTLLSITRLQPEGKRVMSVWEYMRGTQCGDLNGWQWSSQPEKDKG